MKKAYCFCIAFLFTTYAFAQIVSSCASNTYLDENFCENYDFNSFFGKVRIPLALHLGVGAEGFNQTLFENTLQHHVNPAFAEAGIEFYIAVTLELSTSQFDFCEPILCGSMPCEIFDDSEQLLQETENLNVNSMINVYIVNEIIGNRTIANPLICTGYQGLADGYGGNGFAIEAAAIEPLNATLSHELGHVFGLYHTSEEEAFGSLGGDGIVDTPEDPGIQDLESCHFLDNPDYFGLISVEDWNKITMNIMSYADDGAYDGAEIDCRTEFSQCQLVKMREHLEDCDTDLCSNPDAPDIRLSSGLSINYLEFDIVELQNGLLPQLFSFVSEVNGTNTNNWTEWELENTSFGYQDNQLDLNILFNGGYITSPGEYILKIRDKSSINPSCMSDWRLVTIQILPPPTLSLTWPSSNGQCVETGTSQTITWSSTGNITEVDIEYCEISGPCYSITQNISNDGIFLWTVSNSSDLGGFFVRVSDTSNPSISADGPVFQLSDDCTSPICGDDTCDPGEDCQTCPQDCGPCPPTCTSPNITFASKICLSEASYEVQLDFQGTAGHTYKLYSEPQTQVYLGEVPANGPFLFSDITTNQSVQIFVEDESDLSCNSSLTVSPPDCSSPPDLLVTWPSSSNSCFEVGTPEVISWTSSGSIPSLTIEYCVDGTNNCFVIGENIEDDGAAPWTIPGAEGFFYIKIYDPVNTSTVAVGSTFEIASDCEPTPTNLRLELAECMTYPSTFCIGEIETVSATIHNPNNQVWTGRLIASLSNSVDHPGDDLILEILENQSIPANGNITVSFTNEISIQSTSSITLIIAEIDEGLENAEIQAVQNGNCVNLISVVVGNCANSCAAPQNLVVGSISSEGAIGSWAEVQTADSYNVYLGKEGQGFSFDVNTPNDISVFGDLDAGTSYCWYLEAVCGGTTSATSNVVCFDTYQANDALGDFWTTGENIVPSDEVSPGGEISVDGTFRYEGSYVPQIPAKLGFFLSADNLFSPEDIKLGEISWTFAPESSIDPLPYTDNYDFLTNLIVPENIIAGSYSVLFVSDWTLEWEEIDESNNLHVDAITVLAPPECMQPTGLFTSDISNGAATFNYEPNPNANSTHIRYRKIGTTNWTDQFANIDPSVPFTTLDECTDYEWQAQAFCAVNSTSTWTVSAFFSTLCSTGCTDPDAHNYNPNAITDDGSCETCEDGIQNGDEEGIDCGGIRCEDCISCTIVTNTNDSGPGSLREAINCANTGSGADIITFNIAGSGPFVIQLSSASQLPPLTDDNTTIDASSQPNFVPGLIELVSPSQNFGNGFTIEADNCQIYGLKISGFGTGIRMTQYSGARRTVYVGAPNKRNIFFNNANGVGLFGSIPRAIIQSNEFYGDFSSNFTGIHLQSSDNEIGGIDPLKGNIIHDLFRGVAYASTENTNITIQQNQFYCNTTPIYDSPNPNVTTTPQILETSTTSISGTTAPNAAVEVFYADNTCDSDPCQGRDIIAATLADGTGNWSLQGNFIANRVVTATAKSGNLNTSGFSNCKEIGSDCQDITISFLSYDKGAVSADIKNIGTVPLDLNGVDLNFYFSPDVNPTGNAITQIELSGSGTDLNPGESYILNTTIETNINNQAYLVAELDVSDELSECNETNNISAFALTLGCTDPNAHNYDASVNSADGSCETCEDGIQNGDETGIDCGGNLCADCTCTTIVTNVNDNGPGSLREAINCANTNPGGDLISFDLNGSAPFIILLETRLPVLTDNNTIIDGTSQPGYVLGDIVLDGVNVDGGQSDDDGLKLNADGLEIYGLHLKHFTSGDAIEIGSNRQNIMIGDLSKPNIITESKTGIFSCCSNTENITIQGNFIGTDPSGADLGNSRDGVNLQGASNSVVEKNIIAYNGREGILLSGNSLFNRFTQNQIYCNAGLGIAINSSNEDMSPPVIILARETEISGTAGPGDVVEVFYDKKDNCPSARCQGKEYVGTVIADPNGNWTINDAFVTGNSVTATSTNVNGSTSNFSECIDVEVGPCPDLIISTLSYDNGELYAEILNTGTGVADLLGININFSFSLDENPSSSFATQMQLGGDNSLLNPGESHILNSNVDINYNNHPYFVGQVDVFDELSECNETNNISVFALTLGCTDPNAHNYDVSVNSDNGSCETCEDGIQNGDETGIDCGGNLCEACTCTTIVTTTNDSGPGSLREAINCANTNPGGDLISFDLNGSAPFIILLETRLPVLTDNNTIIDGTSQPGYVLGDIVLDGVNVDGGQSDDDGLKLNADGLEIYGLHLKHFTSGDAIEIGSNRQNIMIGDLSKPNIITESKTGIFSCCSNTENITIQGNFIGTDPSGADLGNSRDGVNLQGASNSVVEKNIIAYNGREGILLSGNSLFNRFTQNQIYCNAGLGIAINSSNEDMSPPVIILARETEISGTAGPGDVVEVFYDKKDNCPGARCQGKEYVETVIADPNGNWTINDAFEIGNSVTATSTNVNGSTSNFSECIDVEVGPCPDLIISTLSYDNGELYAEILNTGTGVADLLGININFSFSLDENPSSSFATQMQLGGDNSLLNPGESHILNSNVDINYNNHPYFVGQVDVFDELSECNETNNISVFALTLGCTDPNAHNYDVSVNSDNGSCETCEDGIQNGDETGIDCGGNLCEACTCTTIVTTTNDSGPGSLREAINCANSSAGPDIISFDIAGTGPHLITLNNALPIITDFATVIDASINGYSLGDIIVEGTADTGDGIIMVQGVAGFEMYGLVLRKGSYGGLRMIDCSDFIIGAPGKPNSIYNNGQNAQNAESVYIANGNNGIIQNNRIGITETNNTSSDNPNFGLVVFGTNIMIGGSRTSQEGNTIGNHSIINLMLRSSPNLNGPSSDNIWVQGNNIGTDPSGLENYGSSIGIYIMGDNGFFKIGGESGNLSNKIAFNSDGIAREQGISTVQITKNQIYCNTKGIKDYETSYTYPIISTATVSEISGVSNANDVIEIFSNDDALCPGYTCQGKIFLGSVVADASGNWSFSGVFEAGVKVIATATDSNSNTSEFSDCQEVIACGTVWYLDGDGDGFGDPEQSLVSCTQEVGYVSNSLDCDDADPEVNPSATEVCDGIDNDCNGYTDDADSELVDNEAPVAICQETEVNLDPISGLATITTAVVDNGSNDNCGIEQLEVTPNSFSREDIGNNIVVLTATDASGNSGTCSTTVVVNPALIAYVWDDQDGNGKQNAGEPAIAGASVDLINSSTGAVIQTLETNAGGEAIFNVSGIASSQQLKLRFYEKPNHRFTLKDKGNNDNIDSDAKIANGLTKAFTLASNGLTEKWDAGLWSPGMVQAKVWDDLDGDGKQDATESPIKSVQVNLLESNGTIIGSTLTDNAGIATLTAVPADRPVKLQFFKLENFHFTLKDQGNNDNIDSDARRGNGMTSTFEASKGKETFTNKDAGLWSLGTIEAYVWDDLNGNGKQNASEPGLGGVTVDLLEKNNQLIMTTTTDETGLAIFSGVPADRKVKLQFYNLAGYQFTLKDKGNNDNIDSDAKPSNGRTITFKASKGQELFTKWDAGQIASNAAYSPGANSIERELNAVSPKLDGIDQQIDLSVFPNSFQNQTTIRFRLPEAGEVTLEVYSLQGQIVRRFIDTSLAAGFHEQLWDGTASNGQQVGSGVYLIRLRVGKTWITKKVSLIR